MVDVSHRNFGLMIAYLIPGFVTVWGIGYFSETAQSWLSASPDQAPSVGGFLYLTIASIAAGVTVSAIRWAIIDTLHHWTGLLLPNWDFTNYHARVAAVDAIVQDHYRYYQFYANMFVAVGFVYAARLIAVPALAGDAPWQLLGFAAIEAIFLAGSRDALRKYYTQGERLLGIVAEAAGDNIPGQQENNETGKGSGD